MNIKQLEFWKIIKPSLKAKELALLDNLAKNIKHNEYIFIEPIRDKLLIYKADMVDLNKNGKVISYEKIKTIYK